MILFIWIQLTLSSELKALINPMVNESQKESYYEVSVTKKNQSKEVINLNDYLIGVVAGEMPLSFEDEAIKAQIVASRTYVLSRDLKVDNTTNTQVFLSKDQLKEKWKNDFDTNYQRLKRLVQETNNQVLKYQDQYISALFFSSSNGKTENSEDYFASSSVPYLRSVESEWELSICPNIEREVHFTFGELEQKFSFIVNSIEIIDYKASGRVNNVKVNDKIYTGRNIRELLNLASSDFSIVQDDTGYTFHTVGFGHGVGMSQYGANGMALAGYQYEDILKYYYQGVEIVSL